MSQERDAMCQANPYQIKRCISLAREYRVVLSSKRHAGFINPDQVDWIFVEQNLMTASRALADIPDALRRRLTVTLDLDY